MGRLATAVLGAAACFAASTALAGDTGSRILDSPSRSVIHRNEPTIRSIVPGGDLTRSRSLSGMVGDLNAAGGLGNAAREDESRPTRIYDCVLHHQRLDRTARQPFSTRCDPTVDVAPGYPAHTTR